MNNVISPRVSTQNSYLQITPSRSWIDRSSCTTLPFVETGKSQFMNDTKSRIDQNASLMAHNLSTAFSSNHHARPISPSLSPYTLNAQRRAYLRARWQPYGSAQAPGHSSAGCPGSASMKVVKSALQALTPRSGKNLFGKHSVKIDLQCGRLWHVHILTSM